MLGHRARKRFGQNFLHDEQIIEDIVAAFAPQRGQAIVEIGPGLAALTRPVAQQAGHLHVIEIDRDLAARLQQDTNLAAQLTVHQVDALKFNFLELAEQLGQKIRVFGNLPYNISTPLIFHLLEASEAIEDMHFMLQKEVVERMVASPGSKTYGRLSIMIQQKTEAVPILDVPPEAFTPAPKVDSAVVRLTPYVESPHPVIDNKLFAEVCLTSFSQRRKTIRNNLKQLLTDADFDWLAIEPNVRPETLPVEDYVRISNYLSGNT